MKTHIADIQNCMTDAAVSHKPRRRIFLLLAATLIAVAMVGLPRKAAADVSVNVAIWHGYDFYYPNVRLNADAQPTTFHMVESPNGVVWKQFGGTNGTSNFFLTNNLNAVINECTNGLWKLYLNRGDASEEIYFFAMSITGVTTNLLTDVNVHFPLNGSTGVTNTPTYRWTGPAHFPNVDLQSTHDANGNDYFATLPGTTTNWTPGPLTAGPNTLFVNYYTNNFPGLTFTTPTNASGTPLAGWSAKGDLHSYIFSSFNVTGSGSGIGGHRLEAHYSFEDGNIFAHDYSGNGNHVTILASHTGGKRFTTNNPALGNFSAFFDNNGGSGAGWIEPTNNLLGTLAGSFTVSLWVQTTQTSGSDTDSGLFGNAGLVSAFSGPGANWVLPMALTGNKLAFATGGNPQHTLHSSVPITSSEFVHLVVTRNRTTGEKKIYVNGQLDTSGTGSTELLDSPTGIEIGYNNGTGLQGALDEIQFYSGVLSAAEVEFLYNNPGNTVPNVGSDPDLAEAVDATQLVWTTGGDAVWFLQTDETNDGEDAAQSGAIDNDQESWIETTVTGPGYLSFWWNVSSDDSASFDYLEFTLNGNSESTISGEWGWDFYEIYLEEGEHTLRWTYRKDESNAGGQDAAWLDEVRFEQEIEISMTLTIEQNNDPLHAGFFAYPSFTFVSPEPITSYEIVSPNGSFRAYEDAIESYSSYSAVGTLSEVISELENGDWTLYINRGHEQERVFTFNVAVNDLDISDLVAVNITSPVENATGIATNHTFEWTGPADFDSLFLSSYLLSNFNTSGGFTSMVATATSTKMPHPLVAGSNAVYVSYQRYNFDGVNISEPVDNHFNSPSYWSSEVILVSSQTRRFIVSAEPPPVTPVQILQPQFNGSQISFSLLTQTGRTHFVETRTNLTTAPWIDLTNFVGNGEMLQITLPIDSQAESYFRIRTE